MATLLALTAACSDGTSGRGGLDTATRGPEGPINGSDDPIFSPPGSGGGIPEAEPPSMGGEASSGGGGESVNGGGSGSGGGGGGKPGSAVPEPGTMLLVGTGLAGIAWRKRRRAALNSVDES